MLKTNSKTVRERVQLFINTHVDFSGYDLEKTPETVAEINKAIFACFLSESKFSNILNEQECFIDWCSGLPSILDCCYYLNSAVEMLGDILEETSAERAKYTEEQAERLFSYLIYKEVKRYAN